MFCVIVKKQKPYGTQLRAGVIYLAAKQEKTQIMLLWCFDFTLYDNSEEGYFPMKLEIL